MTAMGFIQPAHTKWAAPIVIAPMNDGTLRFCVYYRQLNAFSMGDAYPIPGMDECID